MPQDVFKAEELLISRPIRVDTVEHEAVEPKATDPRAIKFHNIETVILDLIGPKAFALGTRYCITRVVGLRNL